MKERYAQGKEALHALALKARHVGHKAVTLLTGRQELETPPEPLVIKHVARIGVAHTINGGTMATIIGDEGRISLPEPVANFEPPHPSQRLTSVS